MKRGVWIAIAVGIVFILAAVVVVLMFAPLGPRLPALAATISPTFTPVVFEPSVTPSPIVSPTFTPSPTPAGVCGNAGSMTFMLLGESLYPHGADAIRLAKVDFDKKQINDLALPYNLWVSTPGLYSKGIGGTELTYVYYQGKLLSSSNDREKILAATALFARTLNDNFGWYPEHYVVIKQAAFADVVNAMGGVDIVLPAAVDGRREGKGYFPAGAQHLTGQQVLDLVRITNPAGDTTPTEAERLARQNLVLQAVERSLLTPQNWSRLPDLLQTYQQNVVTDLSVKQMTDLACLLNVPGVSIQQSAIGADLVVPAAHNVLLPRTDLIRQYIALTVGK